ncbi:MAG: rhamnogalacturonan acetylesterase [Lewinellaceae bacterium]|nr:hypothetical protein [Saprospiraceae bacterium]MCB9329675.1 rhamnogalacturonan acetylesterase [Lewinellaceae bacterium]
MKIFLLHLSYLLLIPLASYTQSQHTNQVDPEPLFRFDFGQEPTQSGYTKVSPETIYSPEQGYGFLPGGAVEVVDRGGPDALRRDFCTSTQPFYFSVKVPEGNYHVRMILGDQKGESSFTVKTESRRLAVEEISTSVGYVTDWLFTVNVRNAAIPMTNRTVKLTSRETRHFNWDDQLTIEFSGKKPAICGLEIIPAPEVTTVYLVGNSTVTDQKNEPWASWGQMLPIFFEPENVAIANHAESGESLKRFQSENRLEKIQSTLKAGDYLFIQFGHNDQKTESSAYVAPFTGYKEQLMVFIEAAREKGATPVLVTPVHRRTFDDQGKIINSHGDYPEAMRQVAKEAGVPLIDLHAMSQQLFEALGPEGSKKAFVHFPAGSFPGQDGALADDSHFSTYGAMQLALCIVQGIQDNHLALAADLKSHLPEYDPAKPTPLEKWNLPLSPYLPDK